MGLINTNVVYLLSNSKMTRPFWLYYKFRANFINNNNNKKPISLPSRIINLDNLDNKTRSLAICYKLFNSEKYPMNPWITHWYNERNEQNSSLADMETFFCFVFVFIINNFLILLRVSPAVAVRCYTDLEKTKVSLSLIFPYMMIYMLVFKTVIIFSSFRKYFSPIVCCRSCKGDNKML